MGTALLIHILPRPERWKSWGRVVLEVSHLLGKREGVRRKVGRGAMGTSASRDWEGLAMMLKAGLTRSTLETA